MYTMMHKYFNDALKHAKIASDIPSELILILWIYRLNVEFRKTVTWDLCLGQRSKNIGPKGA